MNLRAALTIDALRAAAHRVARTGMPGADGVPPARLLRDPRALPALRAALADGRHRPGPLLRRERPKPSGGVRALAIPTAADRVVCAWALAAAGPTLDARLGPEVHGWRPGRGPASALRALAAVDRARERPWVQVDLRALFDELPHPALAAATEATGDPLWDPLISRLRLAWATAPGRGLPQGSPLSPLLANLCLAATVDPALRAARAAGQLGPWIRYGDDIVAACAPDDDGLRALAALDHAARAAGLALAAHKVRRGPPDLGLRALGGPVGAADGPWAALLRAAPPLLRG